MKTKRLLSAFLTLVMVLSMVMVPVSAEQITLCTKTEGCALADGHLEECTVPQQTTYCSNDTCLLHLAEAHEECRYCTTENCILCKEVHTECKLPEVSSDCTCTDKCLVDAVNAECVVCAAADDLEALCTGKEAIYVPCDSQGCDLVKGHEGSHTGAGNFVACDGEVSPDACEATTHLPGCSKFKVVDTDTLKAAVNSQMTEITLSEGFTITETILIPSGKNITLDMADKAVTAGANVNPAIRVLGKLTVMNGKMDTATGEAADGYCFIVGGVVNEETVSSALTIESGTYHGAASVISVTKGTASIKAGTFSAEPADGMEDSRYLLNCIDDNFLSGDASIAVSGGTFKEFNPEDNSAEGENTNFLAQGYCVKENEGSFAVAQHQLTKEAASAATCTAAGNIEHWKCGHCGKLYDAAENGNEITAESTVLPVADHTLEAKTAVEGNCEAKGTIAHWQCKICDKLFDAAENGNELTDADIVGDFGTHDLEKQDAIAATCQKNGSIEHYKCTVCESLFEDAAGTATLTEEEIVTTGTHDLKYQGGKDATYDAAGIQAHYYCEVSGCGKKFQDARGETELTTSTVIPKLSYVEDGVLIIDEGAITNEGKKNVVLDLLQRDVMGTLTSVTKAQFQLTCLEDHVDRGGTLWIYMSDGQVYFDNDALKTIVEKAQGDTVTLLIQEITKTDASLTAKQKTALASQKDPHILQLQLTSGGQKITADFEGKVYVYMTGFEPKTGYKNSNYSGYFLAEDGKTEKVSYYSRDARITAEHFSVYFLSRNVKAASSPQTGDTSNVFVWAGVGLAAVAALAVLLIINRKKRK